MNQNNTRFWPCPELAALNVHEINWSADLDPPNCTRCAGIIPGHPVPVQCSHASTLAYMEDVMDSLPDKRDGIRLMMLFKDPPSHLQVNMGHPLGDPKLVGEGESHYFCLTQTAWENLLLHLWTGSQSPSWPTGETAHHFLRRYFRADGQWSYDGIVAYFLWLFRPAQAYITNHAKCNFGVRSQPEEIFETCSRVHLSWEIELFRPDILLSFTSRIRTTGDLLEYLDPEIVEDGPPVLYFSSPRPMPHVDKVRRGFDALTDNAGALTLLGYDADSLVSRWLADATRARDSNEQPPDPPEIDEDVEFYEGDPDDPDLFADDLCDTDEDEEEQYTDITSGGGDSIRPIDPEISRVTVNGRPGDVVSWELVSHDGRLVTQWLVLLDEDGELYEFLSPPAEISELP